jgi:hypothetical protein
MLRSLLAPVILVAASLAPSLASASASAWDLIYADRIDVTLCDGCGITLAGKDFGLLVNTGATDILAPELFGATFSVVSSRPEITLAPFINNPGPPVAPIHPGEAVGSVIASDDEVAGSNAVLLTRLLPGEVHRNTAPLQLIAFQVARAGGYQGPVRFDVTMVMGALVAYFTINADVHLGSHAIAFPGAARVSALPVATPVMRRTWGEIKTRYR